jgi:hypothetical protein
MNNYIMPHALSDIKSLDVIYYGWHDLPQGLWIINEYFKYIYCMFKDLWFRHIIMLFYIFSDVNECSTSPCKIPFSKCKNKPGSYSCDCQYGRPRGNLTLAICKGENWHSVCNFYPHWWHCWWHIDCLWLCLLRPGSEQTAWVHPNLMHVWEIFAGLCE